MLGINGTKFLTHSQSKVCPPDAYGESAAGSRDTSPQATGAGSEVSADSTGDGVADESPDPNSDAGDAAKDPEDN